MRKRYGGFENVGATVDDCKNFRTRINSYIGEYDADMDKRLTGLYWADGLCKRNFMEFGDVISFDATFKTNKYKMVFVPFTGIDNHCRNVTLGARLLASESIDSYKWLLNSFVGHELCNNEEFKRKMCDIVWTDSIEPKVFERQWKLVANSQLTLVKFMNHFDGSMDVQWFNHRKNDHISRYTEPDDWSKTTLKADAAKIYTRSIFFDQQTKIYGTISECLPMDTKIEGDQLRISLKDFKAHGEGFLEMCFKRLEEDVIAQCSCLRFQQYGLLCKHIYFFFKMLGVKEIPNKYVMRRWTKDMVPNELNSTFDVKVDAKDEQYNAKQIARKIMYTGEYLVSNLITNLDQLV
ncbi:protein FAR1-RELATED SEQUENCE 5-like [Helianthus annuus]|uniref:protein FAR1-RELATED SEQUENCE 5-like n=1 Tax=Helianthus annuus TaxID=4232 RepID=UPI000B8F17A4|nr:protein FAR1-RELATED SEQUENCE 5-like [Helianthus annuus]